MTDKDFTYLLMISDRSGSMGSVREEAEGSINAFFEKQAKEPGKCLAQLVQFDDEYDVVFEDKPIAEVPKYELVPRGMTGMLDAIGRAVTSLGVKLAAMAEGERPASVLVSIMTDGHENASREWTYERVLALIKEQQDKYGWQVTFMGANIDAVSVGAMIGVRAANALSFNAKNIHATMDSYSGQTSNYRGAVMAGASPVVASAAMDWSDEDREAAMKEPEPSDPKS